MATTKYKQFFNLMFEENKELFQKFMLLCQDYMKNKKRYKEQFDKEGEEVIAIVKHWENKLCKQMERGGKAMYSSALSDKFWAEVRTYFPCIDEVGVKVSHI